MLFLDGHCIFSLHNYFPDRVNTYGQVMVIFAIWSIPMVNANVLVSFGQYICFLLCSVHMVKAWLLLFIWSTHMVNAKLFLLSIWSAQMANSFFHAVNTYGQRTTIFFIWSILDYFFIWSIHMANAYVWLFHMMNTYGQGSTIFSHCQHRLSTHDLLLLRPTHTFVT